VSHHTGENQIGDCKSFDSVAANETIYRILLLGERIARNTFHLIQADREGERPVVLLPCAKMTLTVVRTET
jgi:hypothetical protein